MSEIDPSRLKVTELRAELQARGLETKGVKPVLVERLQAALDEEFGIERSPQDTDDEEEIEEEELEQKPTRKGKTPVKGRGSVTPVKGRNVATPGKGRLALESIEETADQPAFSMKKSQPKELCTSPVKEAGDNIHASSLVRETIPLSSDVDCSEEDALDNEQSVNGTPDDALATSTNSSASRPEKNISKTPDKSSHLITPVSISSPELIVQDPHSTATENLVQTRTPVKSKESISVKSLTSHANIAQESGSLKNPVSTPVKHQDSLLVNASVVKSPTSSITKSISSSLLQSITSSTKVAISGEKDSDPCSVENNLINKKIESSVLMEKRVHSPSEENSVTRTLKEEPYFETDIDMKPDISDLNYLNKEGYESVASENLDVKDEPYVVDVKEEQEVEESIDTSADHDQDWKRGEKRRAKSRSRSPEHKKYKPDPPNVQLNRIEDEPEQDKTVVALDWYSSSKSNDSSIASGVWRAGTIKHRPMEQPKPSLLPEPSLKRGLLPLPVRPGMLLEGSCPRMVQEPFIPSLFQVQIRPGQFPLPHRLTHNSYQNYNGLLPFPETMNSYNENFMRNTSPYPINIEQMSRHSGSGLLPLPNVAPQIPRPYTGSTLPERVANFFSRY